MKLLIDMNLSQAWGQFGAGAGFESQHWSEIGKADAPDTEIFDYASANDLIIFTHDLDFGALLATCRLRRPSVIQIRAQDVLPAAIGEMVVRALHASRSHLEAGALVTGGPKSEQDSASADLAGARSQRAEDNSGKWRRTAAFRCLSRSTRVPLLPIRSSRIDPQLSAMTRTHAFGNVQILARMFGYRGK